MLQLTSLSLFASLALCEDFDASEFLLRLFLLRLVVRLSIFFGFTVCTVHGAEELGLTGVDVDIGSPNFSDCAGHAAEELWLTGAEVHTGSSASKMK